jgi:hypothetical protein
MTDAKESEFQPLPDLQGREIQLVRHGFSLWAWYELVAGRDRFGSMRPAPDGSLLTPVVVTLAAGSWEIRARDGFSSQVQTVPDGRVSAIITTHLLHLHLDLEDGSRIVGGYDTPHVWVWRDSQGRAVLRQDTPLARLGGLRPTSRLWFVDGSESQAYADVLTAVALAVARASGA